MDMLKRIKRVRGYAAHSRYLAELAETPSGYIPMQHDIKTPFAYSPSWTVWRHCPTGRLVIVCETAHRQYDVFEVPRPMLTTAKAAEDGGIAGFPRRAA
jgi:hypothetical protein